MWVGFFQIRYAHTYLVSGQVPPTGAHYGSWGLHRNVNKCESLLSSYRPFTSIREPKTCMVFSMLGLLKLTLQRAANKTCEFFAEYCGCWLHKLLIGCTSIVVSLLILCMFSTIGESEWCVFRRLAGYNISSLLHLRERFW